jgi:hypothetical protein
MTSQHLRYSVFPMSTRDPNAPNTTRGNFVKSPYVHGSDWQLRELRRHYYAAVSWADFATGKILVRCASLCSSQYPLATIAAVTKQHITLVRCAFFDRDLHTRSAIEFHAFAPLEALADVRPISFLSSVHSLIVWHCNAAHPLKDELDNLGLASSTMVVLHSDHGWHLGEYAMWEKRSNWELGTRVPLIMRVPWVPNSAGARSKALVRSAELFPLCQPALPSNQ